MKKALIVCPGYRPNNIVSINRIDEICSFLENYFDVDISTADLNTSLASNDVKIMPRKSLASIQASCWQKENKYFVDLFSGYDLIIISVPEFTYASLVPIGKLVGAKVILDIRDLPDMIYFNFSNQRRLLRYKRYIMLKLTEKYLSHYAKKADSCLCVGEVSKKILETKFGISASNIHNGINDDDLVDFKPFESTIFDGQTIKVALCGSIYGFRTTNELFNLIITLGKFSRFKIKIVQIGTIDDRFKSFLKGVKGLDCEFLGRLSRTDYFSHLNSCHAAILATSNDLVWEPTTTVFDYILTDKPTIFVGRAMEAKNILRNSGLEFTDHSELSENRLLRMVNKKQGRVNKLQFLRSTQIKALEPIIKKLFCL